MSNYIDDNYVNNNYGDMIKEKREEFKRNYDNLMRYISDGTSSSLCRFLGISKEEYRKLGGNI